MNGSLQLGIEESSGALIKDLGASSTACSSALGFEQSGDVVQANWTTLTGIVEGGDRPASRAVIGALARSRSYLADLRALFPDIWRDRAKVNKLILTVAQMQTGIRLLQVAVRSLGVAFERWEQHDCTGAQEAIAAANLRIHTAVGAINHGIERMALELRASEAAVDPSSPRAILPDAASRIRQRPWAEGEAIGRPPRQLCRTRGNVSSIRLDWIKGARVIAAPVPQRYLISSFSPKRWRTGHRLIGRAALADCILFHERLADDVDFRSGHSKLLGETSSCRAGLPVDRGLHF